MLDLQNILALTALLRLSEDPFWCRLRDLLLARGVDPTSAALAECFPDDSDFEFGIVVTADAQVFQFGFSYYQKPVQLGELTEWNDLTQTYATATHRPSIELALRCLRDGPSETAG